MYILRFTIGVDWLRFYLVRQCLKSTYVGITCMNVNTALKMENKAWLALAVTQKGIEQEKI